MRGSQNGGCAVGDGCIGKRIGCGNMGLQVGYCLCIALCYS